MNKRKETLTALLFASPWFVGFTVFLLYPIIASIYLSFCDYSVLRPAVFIGLQNYSDLINDSIFKQALSNTVIYTAAALPLGLVVSLGLAMLLNTKVKGLAFYRTLFYMPSLVPLVALAILMQFIFNGQYGVLNSLLREFLPFVHGKSWPPNWLGDPRFSKLVLIFISAWGAGNAMVIYLAGLQDVPVQLYEAAQLDGAGWWSTTRNVTIPMISPVILFNLVMGIIGTLQVFTLPYVISNQGSPMRSIYFYTMYLFDNAFVYHKMGYACAMGWILFIIILLLTLLSFKLSEKHVHYGS